MTQATDSTTGYLAQTPPDPAEIAQWVEQFHRDGFLFIKNVLPPALCTQLRADLDARLAIANEAKSTSVELVHRMFEQSAANFSLFDLEPIVSFAEALVGPSCHVVHNNSFRTPPGGGFSTWHQDDAAHMTVTDGKPPTNIRMAVLFFTANYYLTDVESPEYGTTEVVPGSHLFGRNPFADEEPPAVTANCGPAGSVVLFNNQVWHRGGPNQTQRTRYITQITYARRCIGHFYSPFMNYQLPEHIMKAAEGNPRLRRLIGFKSNGAYG